METVKEIEVDKIEDPIIKLHPNPDINYLRELADSIKQIGQQQPIVVRPRGDKYQLIIGYCRTQAAKIFGIPKLKAIIKECNDAEAMIMASTENIHRLEQDPIMEANLLNDLKTKYGYSEDKLAKKFGKSVSYIKSRLALLKLTEEVQELVKNKQISLGIAVELSRIEDPDLQTIAAIDFVKNPTTVAHATAIINSLLETPKEALQGPTEEDIQKIRSEVKVKCDFCGRMVPYEDIKAYNMCSTCFHGSIYLFEKERREKEKLLKLEEKET